VPRGVLLDASYSSNSALRIGISALEFKYVAAVVANVKVRQTSERGAPEPRLSVKQLALTVPKHAWRTITWREGTNDRLRSRFARVRVHTSPTRGRRGRSEETLLIEWPEGKPEPTKYWLTTVDKNISFRALVDLAKCAGGSSAITRNSSRKSGWGTMRGADDGSAQRTAAINAQSGITTRQPPIPIG
jgi:DDE superfamily endonuclease